MKQLSFKTAFLMVFSTSLRYYWCPQRANHNLTFSNEFDPNYPILRTMSLVALGAGIMVGENGVEVVLTDLKKVIIL